MLDDFLCSPSSKFFKNKQKVIVELFYYKLVFKAGVVAQKVKLQVATQAFHIGVPVGVPTNLLLSQLPANAPGRAPEDGPSPQALAIQVRDQG